jgi:hypothetical protein
MPPKDNFSMIFQLTFRDCKMPNTISIEKLWSWDQRVEARGQIVAFTKSMTFFIKEQKYNFLTI